MKVSSIGYRQKWLAVCLTKKRRGIEQNVPSFQFSGARWWSFGLDVGCDHWPVHYCTWSGNFIIRWDGLTDSTYYVGIYTMLILWTILTIICKIIPSSCWIKLYSLSWQCQKVPSGAKYFMFGLGCPITRLQSNWKRMTLHQATAIQR